MKKTLLLCILVALCFGGAARAWAAADPGDRFLEAYFLIQEGDAAVHESDWTKANTKYGGALDILNEIKTDSPDWNPHIIEFRSKYINDHLSEVKAKLALSSGTPPQPHASVGSGLRHGNTLPSRSRIRTTHLTLLRAESPRITSVILRRLCARWPGYSNRVARFS